MKFVESKVMIVENLINCRNLYNFVQKQTKKGVSPLYWGLPDISECQAGAHGSSTHTHQHHTHGS